MLAKPCSQQYMAGCQPGLDADKVQLYGDSHRLASSQSQSTKARVVLMDFEKKKFICSQLRIQRA